MNQYAEDLKAKLNQVDQYVLHNQSLRADNVFSDTLIEDPKKFTVSVKNILWIIGIAIIAISVVAFFTQTALLVSQNIRNGTTQVSPTLVGQTVAVGNNMYVRADLNSSPFEQVSETQKNVSIPGVTRIGYNDAVGDEALSNNINKYGANTLVLGGREGEAGAQGTTIGGGDPTVPTESRYSLLPKSIEPVLSSRAYMVGDLETGEVIVEKNIDTVYPLASVSKLMTALVAREKMDMQSVAIVSRDASRAYGAQGALGLGEKIRLRDLLFPLLMESSNDAAEVFADQYGHAEFIQEMNKKAVSLEMRDTYYGDPSGLDPQNTSSPRDMFTLARHIMKADPEIFDMTRVKQFSIKNHTWYNRNPLLLYAGYIGGKNGYIDQSRQTTVSLFEVPLAKGGVRTVVVVILKSDNKNNDVTKLINYLKKSVVYQVE